MPHFKKVVLDRFAPPYFMERTSPIISVNHVHTGVGMKKKKLFFENHTKKKLFIICFRTQLSQKITLKIKFFFRIFNENLGCPGWSPSSVSTPFTLGSAWFEKKLSYFSKKSNVQNIFKMCFRTQMTKKKQN